MLWSVPSRSSCVSRKALWLSWPSTTWYCGAGNVPALRLTQADRDDERSEAFEALARLLRNLAMHSPEALEVAVDDVFAWLTFLPKTDRELVPLRT